MISLPVLAARRVSSSVMALQSVRAYAGGYWNKDWKPGPYPKTEKERRAAAKKYGMVYEDYEPYPDDGWGYGDYPKLPIVSAESRDPHENYDHDEHKRYHGEVMHVDCDMYGEDRIDYNRRLPASLLEMNLTFFGVVGAIFLFFWASETILPKVSFCKKMPKHMPGDGKKHYTFELEEGPQKC